MDVSLPDKFASIGLTFLGNAISGTLTRTVGLLGG